jgi:hypothetical protein
MRRSVHKAATVGLLSLAGAATVWLFWRSDRDAPEEAESAVRRRTALSRQSSIAALKPFNAVEFEANPDAYLREVEPGRCFQTARAKGPDDVRLKLASSAFVTISRGETAVLKVKGAPRAPVTFTSFNGGVFEESRLGSVTVRADAEGLAEARFSVGPGIAGDLRIQVGSPLAVGAQKFLVRVAE